MSDTAKQLFEGLKELAPGLKNFGAEVSAEFSRLGTQGLNELASALFQGHAYLPYGPGQITPSVDQEKGQEQTQEQGHDREMGLER